MTSDLQQAAMIVIGAALFFFPEVITSIVGAILILGAFGLEDKAPTA